MNQVLLEKVRDAVRKTLVMHLEEAKIDFKKMNYDDLLATIHSVNAEVLEEIADDILDNEKLSWDEKVALWDEIDRVLARGVER